MDINTLWFEVALVCGTFAFGDISFGHFETHTPKIRRVLKLIFLIVLVVLLSKFLGRPFGLGLIALSLLGAAFIHIIWLPRKGINGWTGEPKEKYYKMRGWEKHL